jgi:hypothetical protein
MAPRASRRRECFTTAAHVKVGMARLLYRFVTREYTALPRDA